MNTKELKAGVVAIHNNVIGTIKEIDGVWISFTSGYVCHIDYVNYYECTENEYDYICDSIRYELGIKNVFNCLCRFDWFILFIKSLGYEYKKADDKNECHVFYNSRNGYELLLHPVCYYPNQGLFRVCNITVI